LIVADDTQMRAVLELPVMTQEVGYQASFAEAKRRDDGWIDCAFDISWRRAGRSSSPTELLMLIHRRYAVVAFALTTEDGR
jgi:putative Mg2+ transporter-C (MgtC) family protein